MPTVLITGANGFIARRIAERCHANGWRVVGTVRGNDTPEHLSAAYQCALGGSLEAVLTNERVEVVVHTANHAGPGEYEINVNGTLRWATELKGQSPLWIFLSSLSAAATHPSEYGRAKRDLETHFLASDGIVIRLGLVAGNGGLFARMIDSVKSTPLLPLLDNGKSPVYLVSPRFLLDFLIGCIRNNGDGVRGQMWHVHQPRAYSLREVLAEVRHQTGSSCRFLPIPSALVLWPLTLLERLPFLTLPVTSTNVRGLRAAPRDVATDLLSLGGRETSLHALIGEALENAGKQPA
jgi:uncharacterized protein YbjT (DUF2867 family)